MRAITLQPGVKDSARLDELLLRRQTRREHVEEWIDDRGDDQGQNDGLGNALGPGGWLHPGWTPRQVKSALVSTAGPAWADTARAREAPVTLAGGGLVDLTRAATPQVFTEPASCAMHGLETLQRERS